MKGIVGDHYTMFHTVAHRLELGITAAIGELVEDLESLVKDLYKHYQNSPKQKAGLKRIAEVLGTYDPVAFIGLHGIRWVASKVRALINIIKNLQMVNVDLHRKSVAKLPKLEFNECSLSLMSPAADFVGFKFEQDFGGDTFAAEVVSVKSVADPKETNDFDLFEIKYSDNEKRELSRNDLIYFADQRPGRQEAWNAMDAKGKKRKIPERDLWLRLTNYTNLAMLHHMYDTLVELRKLSLLMQKDQLIYQPLADGIKQAVRVAETSKSRDGPFLRKFKAELDDSIGRQAEATFRHLPLHNHDDGENEFKELRTSISEQLTVYLKKRFDSITSETSGIAAWAPIFNASDWCTNSDSFVAEDDSGDGFGDSEVAAMAKFYHKFLGAGSADDLATEALLQWSDFKELMAPKMKAADLAKRNSKGPFNSLPHHQFWKKAAKMYWKTGNYNHIFRLVAITFMYPWDNSCCERGFSTMNRIKCRLRSSLSSKLLDQLMRISMCGPPLRDWDPRPAIKKWHAMKKRRLAAAAAAAAGAAGPANKKSRLE